MKYNVFIKNHVSSLLKNYILYFCFIFIIISCSKIYNKEEKPFYRSLKNNYETYSQYKAQNFDWEASKIFRNKAIKIKQGFVVEPENIAFINEINDFFYNDATYIELKNMYNRMNIILNNGYSKKQYPDETANLQFYYDCWLIEEKNYKRYGQISRCKQGFLDTLSYLEFRLLQLSTQEQDLILKKIDENKEEFVFIKPKKYIIYFDFDSSAINQQSSIVIWNFIEDIQKIKNKYIINIIGHADRVGSKEYNEKLSKRRADTIKHYLIRNGVPEESIKVKWQGEINPLVITKNDFKEELNRRVDLEIKILE